MISDEVIDLLIGCLIWVPVLLFNGWLSVKLYQRNQTRQNVKFLKELLIKFPDAEVEYFFSIESDSREALLDLRRQVHEHIEKLDKGGHGAKEDVS